MMGPGTLTKYGSALRTPIGPIHWAGAEAATEWAGYMNGAIESGFRAAMEAVLALAAAGAAPPGPPTPPGAGPHASGRAVAKGGKAA